MSARGARSRKAVAKDIEKKDKRKEAKQFADSFPRPGTAFDDWTGNASPQPQIGHPSRAVSQITSTSSLPSTSMPVRPARTGTIASSTSGDFRPFHRPTTSASGSTISTSSSAQEKAKYQAKGKPTKAPRGRGGGVPPKKSSSAPPFPVRASSSARAESSSSLAGGGTPKSWANFTIWHGNDHGVRPYPGFQFDEDLQMGSVLIYFKEEQINEDNPQPQLRVSYDALMASGSTWLVNQLNYGAIDNFEDDFTPPMSPELSTHTLRFSAINPGSRYLPDAIDPGHLSSQDFQDHYLQAPTMRSASRNGGYYAPDAGSRRHLGNGFNGPTPPASTTASSGDRGSVYEREPLRPTHEIWFTAPAHVRSPQGQRLHNVAVRNFLAILHNKPIVGRDLFEMLSTLQPEIEAKYDLDHNEHTQTSARMRSVQMITRYLANRKLDDLRNSLRRALSLLAWAEQDTIRWEAGYIESFVHLVGMMSPDVEEMTEFRRLSAVTRRNLGMSANALQLRVLEAEERLSTFDFSDMWEDPKALANNPIFKSFVAFRQFLLNFFTKAYGSWPPPTNKRWLNRKAAHSLQQDFGALYDYLVNRDVVWDSQEERPGKKWQMSNQDPEEEFQADSAELPLTDMLVGFDNRHGYLHIPHPYPLLPRFVNAPKAPEKKGFFSSMKKPKMDPKKDAKTHLQLSIVFSDATNIQRLGVSFAGNALIDHFEQFELAADLKSVSPRESRLGRWVLLYGILQVLSKLSVDTKGLKYADGVQYFLCADLKRTPPWETTGGAHGVVEASQLASWCWQRDWDESRPNVVQELEAQDSMRRELDAITTQRDGGGQRVASAPPPVLAPPAVERQQPPLVDLGKAREFDRMHVGRAQEFEHRLLVNEYKGFEFGEAKLGSRMSDQPPKDILLEDGVYRPHVPVRSPLRDSRSYMGSANLGQDGYFEDQGGMM